MRAVQPDNVRAMLGKGKTKVQSFENRRRRWRI